jgi:hypothetical protein
MKEFESEITLFGPTITNNKWVHLMGTYDGTVARFYIDGVIQSEVDVDKAAVDNAR